MSKLTPDAEAYLEELLARATELNEEKAKIEEKLSEFDDQIEAVLGDFGLVKEEGSKTTHAGAFKVTATGRMYRKVDAEKWENIKGVLTEEGLAVVEYKPKVSTKGFKWLRDNDPSEFKKICAAVTETPGKTGIKIERKSEE